MKVNRKFVEFILRNASSFEWSIQGLGMMRMYISPEIRIHVWHRSLIRSGVTFLHTHPWDFESEVIAGKITYKVFHEVNKSDMLFTKQKILCGEGGFSGGA